MRGNISYVSGDDRAALGARLCSRKLLFDEQVMAEAMAPPYGDTFLAELVESAPWPANVWIAGRLGDLRGEAGTTVLRRLAGATGPHTRDLRCVSVLALAKRCGEQATPWLAEALGARDGDVKEFAIIGLAGAGDDRAWDLVAERLDKIARKGSRSIPSEVLMAVGYLAQHVGDDSRRRVALVGIVRRDWSCRSEDEQRWFEDYWPETEPNGPPADRVPTPNAEAIRAWVRSQMFESR